MRTDALRRWAALLGLSLLLAWPLERLQAPGAVLLGCMLAGVVLSLRQQAVQVPRTLFGWGQGLLGCLMAHSLHPDQLGPVLAQWPSLLGVALALLLASSLLGVWLTQRRLMPGSTAIWGLMPGAASAMVVMSEHFGADMRLVAFMQYTRVMVVTALAAVVAHAAQWAEPAATPMWAAHPDVVQAAAAVPAAPLPAPAGAAPETGGAPSLRDLAGTLALVGALTWLARRVAMPGGAMVLPLLAASALQALGWLDISLPPALLWLAYAAIGWSVGLRFTPQILRHARHALPQVLAATLAQIGVGLLSAWVLWRISGLDALSAYLATSPGGADSMAVLAATSQVQTSSVMAVQLARFLLVLALGPSLARWLTRWVERRGSRRV